MGDHHTVYIVDDDLAILKTMSRALTKRGYRVDIFSSAQEFLTAYKSNFKGCIVLDLSMPDIGGLALQQTLNDKNIFLPIIFITGHGGVADSVKAIKAGAINFIEKPFLQPQLVAAIEDAFQLHDQMEQTQNEQSNFRNKFLKLSVREQEILALLVKNSGDVSSKALARKLDISHRTVDQHRTKIFLKMDVKSMTELMGNIVRFTTQYGSLPNDE